MTNEGGPGWRGCEHFSTWRRREHAPTTKLFLFGERSKLPTIQSNIASSAWRTKPMACSGGYGSSGLRCACHVSRCISHGIASDHGGTLDVETALGRGTTVTLTLPAETRG